MATLEGLKNRELLSIGVLTLDDAGKQLIQHYTSVRVKARTVNGVLEIGYGHRIHPDGTPLQIGDTLTRRQASELFDYSMQRFIRAVRIAIKRPLQQHEFNALVSLSMWTGTFMLPYYDIRTNTRKKRVPELISRINGTTGGKRPTNEFVKDTRKLWESLWLPDKEPQRTRVRQRRATEVHYFLTGELILQ